MAVGKGGAERLRRAFFTLFFMVTMVVSLLALSAPVLVAIGDVAASLAFAARLACAGCHSLREHARRYAFRSSLMDVPLLSIVRSVVITCVYSLYQGPSLSGGPYLGTATICSSASLLLLLVKACVFTPLDIDDETTSPLNNKQVLLKRSWGMPVLFLSSLVFALGHVVVAYRAACRARRKLLLHRLDPEAALACKNGFSGYSKVPRSPTPGVGRNSKSDSESKRKALIRDAYDSLPVSLLADPDSLFISCEGLIIHYKLCSPESPLSLSSSPFCESSLNCSPPNGSPIKFRVDRPIIASPKCQVHSNRSLSNQFNSSNLYTPLLSGPATLPTFLSDDIPAMCLDNGDARIPSPVHPNMEIDLEDSGKHGIILIHGFGGGVFSWRHVMVPLARQLGFPVIAFDRPGWGLTSRPRRKDWEQKKLPNPYKLECQVDLLLSFCYGLGFSSVVLVGHDDGGLLALKVAEKIQTSTENFHVSIKGVVLVNTSLSREVVPAFARILLHTSLGKKHMVRRLLRTEITQVINSRAWYDPAKLTTDVLNLYKAPLFVEGWDEALHEIGRLSFATVLSSQNAELLLKSVGDLPVLVVAGAEDALVSLKSSQVMASKLLNSRLVAISGCGHLLHEECPKALLAALSPFITRLLLSSEGSSQRQP